MVKGFILLALFITTYSCDGGSSSGDSGTPPTVTSDKQKSFVMQLDVDTSKVEVAALEKPLFQFIKTAHAAQNFELPYSDNIKIIS